MSTKSRTRSLATTADTAYDQIKSLLSEAEQALANAAERPAEEIKALRGRMHDALKEGRVTARHAVKYARAQAVRADEAVHTYPYAALGIAAGVALLIGLAVGRGTSSR